MTAPLVAQTNYVPLNDVLPPPDRPAPFPPRPAELEAYLEKVTHQGTEILRHAFAYNIVDAAKTYGEEEKDIYRYRLAQNKYSLLHYTPENNITLIARLTDANVFSGINAPVLKAKKETKILGVVIREKTPATFAVNVRKATRAVVEEDIAKALNSDPYLFTLFSQIQDRMIQVYSDDSTVSPVIVVDSIKKYTGNKIPNKYYLRRAKIISGSALKAIRQFQDEFEENKRVWFDRPEGFREVKFQDDHPWWKSPLSNEYKSIFKDSLDQT